MASLNGRKRPSPSHNTGENSNLPQPHSLIQHSTDLVWIGEWLPSIFITQTIKCFRLWLSVWSIRSWNQRGKLESKEVKNKITGFQKGPKISLFIWLCLFHWSFLLVFSLIFIYHSGDCQQKNVLFQGRPWSGERWRRRSDAKAVFKYYQRGIGGLSHRAWRVDNTFQNHPHKVTRTLELPEPITMPAAAIWTSWRWWQEACRAAESRALHTFKQNGRETRRRASPLQPRSQGCNWWWFQDWFSSQTRSWTMLSLNCFWPFVPFPSTTPSLLQCSMIGWTCDSNHFVAVKLRSAIG